MTAIPVRKISDIFFDLLEKKDINDEGMLIENAFTMYSMEMDFIIHKRMKQGEVRNDRELSKVVKEEAERTFEKVMKHFKF